MSDDVEKDLDRLMALRIEKLRAAKYSYDELLEFAASHWILADIRGNVPLKTEISLPLSDVVSKVVPSVVRKAVAATKSYSGKHAAEMNHGKPGGSREKKLELQTIWASGHYRTRDNCVEEMSRYLNMAPSTARKALQGTPDPNPWPAKDAAK